MPEDVPFTSNEPPWEFDEDFALDEYRERMREVPDETIWDTETTYF